MNAKRKILAILTLTMLSMPVFTANIPTTIQASVQAETGAKWMEAKAECVMEKESRRILYANHADVCLPMASTTKIATATTVLLECDNLQEEIIIPQEATGITGSSVYLQSGAIYTVKDLLYGLMLRSGNDCATALALRFGGSEAGFAVKMNDVAQKAGALNTHFKNPHGLPCSGHYTTARDLSLITCYALQNPVFQEIISTKYYAPRAWKNKNKMLSLYDGAIGVKTGYTKEAGRCLVSAATRENMTLICTVLNCSTTYERSIQLLDDAFKAYSKEKLLSREQIFSITDGKTTVDAQTNTDFYYPILKEEKEWIETRVKGVDSGLKTKKQGEIVGEIEIYLAKRLLFLGNLYKL